MFLLAGALAYGGRLAARAGPGFRRWQPGSRRHDGPDRAQRRRGPGAGPRHLGRRRPRLHRTRRRTWLGTAVWLLRQQGLHRRRAATRPRLWRAVPADFPARVSASLFLCVTTHLGLAGRRMSEETREWWGRVGGVQLLVALLLTVVGIIALAGPHLPEFLASRWAWFGEHQTAVIGSVLGGLWAALTGAGVAVGRVERTRAGDGHAAPGVDGTDRAGVVRHRLPADPVRAHPPHVVVRLGAHSARPRATAKSYAHERAGAPRRRGLACRLTRPLARSRRRLPAGASARRTVALVGVVAGGPEPVLAPPTSTATGWCAAFLAPPGSGKPNPVHRFRQRRRPAALGRRRTSAAAHPALSDLQRRAQPGGRHRTWPGNSARPRRSSSRRPTAASSTASTNRGKTVADDSAARLRAARASTPATSGR